MLWQVLRNHRLDGHGFRRQTPIGPYFADFVCLQRKLIVEADGRTHEPFGREGRTTPSATHGFIARDFACCDSRTI